MIQSILGPIRRLAHRVWSWRIRHSLTQPDARRLMGLDLVVAPGVLHPGHFLSSRLMAQHLLTLPLADRRVVDLGTGSGFLGLVAARAGANVLALDINPDAVTCAGANARRNGLASRMEVRLSDVFDGLAASERFDLVVTNPPFYPRPSHGFADHAFAAGPAHAFMSRLALDLDARLAPGGELLMIHSSDTDFAPVEALMAESGFRPSVLSARRGLFETLTIRSFRRAAETD